MSKKNNTTTTEIKENSSSPLLFNAKNYKIMILGLIVIFIGFALMLGKNNADPSAVFPAEDIYSFRRIVLAPIVVIAGFLIELYAILLVKKK